MSTRTLMTVEEFAEMPTADTEAFELVEGELLPLSSGTPRHGLVRDFIARIMWHYLDKNSAGKSFAEIDCRTAEATVRCPDVSVFLEASNRKIDLDRIPIPFAPDIAVEVLSPSEGAIDVHRKVRDYLDAGCQEVWVIDYVNGEMFIHSKAAIRMLVRNDVLESQLLPGLVVPVSEIFAV